MNFSEKLQQTLGKAIKDASNEEIYAALLNTVKEAAADKGRNISEKGRKVYYISAEFLIGKLLSNNLINLGVYDEVRELLAANGKDICEIEEVEPEPSLGNGGLGRLAACFLDSIATLSLPGDGVGLNYHCGLFRQEFKNRKQMEEHQIGEYLYDLNVPDLTRVPLPKARQKSWRDILFRRE